MDGLPKTFRKPQVEPVKRGIGKNNAPDGIVAFEPDGLHGVKLPGVSPFSSAYAAHSQSVITASNKCEGGSAS
jgi:hypothetical protein